MFLYLINNYPDKDDKVDRTFNLPKNKLFDFSYEITNNTPYSLDICDYSLTLFSRLKSELAIKSIKLCFTNETRNKNFHKEKYVISSNKSILLNYSLMTNNNDDQLKLKSICIELDLEKPITFEILCDIQIEKVLQIKKNKYDVIEFNYPKKIKISNNQFFNFGIEVLKK